MIGEFCQPIAARVGEALKLNQRELCVRKQGIDLIPWTVNPLEGVERLT
ncbi:MAG: hypothetical protein IPJ47_15115 [Anaerolineales bacterium]|nr:hypothetical protein [Anaerolineales bacterium]